MASKRVLIDIRYYERGQEVLEKSPWPSAHIFNFPKSIHPLGARFARKLGEYGFAAGEYNHLYIAFTPKLPQGAYRFSTRPTEDWFREVEFGLSEEATKGLSDAAKESLVQQATLSVLRFVAASDPHLLATIDRVEAEINEKGSELEIVHMTKDTARYTVTVSYQIEPKGKQSIGLVAYRDKKSGETLKSEFVKLNDYADVVPLVGAISVSRGKITLKPRTSFKASLYTRDYRVPITIPISGLSAA